MEPQQKAAGFNSLIRTARQLVSPAEFERMVAKLSPDSAAIVVTPAFDASWIPLALTHPVFLALAEDLLGGSEERICELGRQVFKADFSGIYKLFIRIASPAYVAERASKIYDTYNRHSGTMRLIKSGAGYLDVVVENYPLPSRPLWHYIRGCITGTLELTGVHSLSVTISEGGDDSPRCLYHASWK